ncbi:MAG: HTH domain-containing protein [Myxococcota bacterium]
MTRAERLFALAEHLRARRTGVTAEALAERFGVTVRTIYRDLASLRAAELPLHAERGRGGGYALDRRYTLPPVNFTPREAAVLIGAGDWLARMRILPFARTLAGAVDKVRAALDASAQRALGTELERLDYIGVPAPPVPPEVRAALEEAFFEDGTLRIRYLGRDALETVRDVRVERILMDRSETLLNVVQRGAHGLSRRQLKLHRVLAAEVLPPEDGLPKS